MSDVYQAYLALLRSLTENLDQLSVLAQRKADAANGDDLMALDEVMKQEQAMTLAFRGMEQTREKLLQQMDCGSVPLNHLAEHFPPELQSQARETVAALQGHYQSYRKAADDARLVLERHLREIDAIITEMEPPKNMKTDFRA